MRANMIRSKLALHQMSQYQLAQRLGVSKNTMSSRMTGRTSFTLDEVEKLCEILEISDPREQRETFLALPSHK